MIKDVLLEKQMQLKKDIIYSENFYAEHSTIANELTFVNLFVSKENIINLYWDTIEKNLKFEIAFSKMNNKWPVWKIKIKKQIRNKEDYKIKVLINFKSLEEISLENGNFILFEYF